MTQVFIFALEPLDSRYTKQWYDEVPRQFNLHTGKDAITVVGKQRSQSTTKGAFLDFADTNYWKSTQLAEFTNMMQKGNVPDDAVLLFTDFWNPTIIQVAYMRDLLGKKWKIHSIAHAGAYDPSDILGYKMGSWSHDFERSLYFASDKTYFATEFHRKVFIAGLDIKQEQEGRAVVAGQPYKYLNTTLAEFDSTDKTDTVMWPHRYNDDKQPEIAEDLSRVFSVFITQKHQLKKNEYYAKLAKSKIVFSCSLHENLGMSMIEGTLVGCLPIAPDRAAYSEIYMPEFLYPAHWTESLEAYQKYAPYVRGFIDRRLQEYDKYAELLPEQVERIQNFIDPTLMFQHMLGDTS
jgi:hypothetical protein